ncbi:hypothetical protein [Nocardia blacklockiae]|uniref:hypothetical protein n=1 Tax=Nocardia blacklockiae TaxID=480036 RepID=UPI0018934939|nr:hypothetical protein [Nocardia blacklockiae]MBF6176037.1 hypothetical protein [Nocardia blacklockiae]
MTRRRSIPATEIPLWQRLLLEQIQTLSADCTHLADTAADHENPDNRLAADLRHLHNRRLDAIRRADILGVPGAWIDLARLQGDAGRSWQSETALPSVGGTRARLLDRLRGQLATLEEMAVVDTERHHRRIGTTAPPRELVDIAADDYLRTTLRHNMNLQWQLASTYADAIVADSDERDRVLATIAADRPHTLHVTGGLDHYTLERKWEAFASQWFGADVQRLTDTLEPDPDHLPAQPTTGFPTPYTVLPKLRRNDVSTPARNSRLP